MKASCLFVCVCATAVALVATNVTGWNRLDSEQLAYRMVGDVFPGEIVPPNANMCCVKSTLQKCDTGLVATACKTLPNCVNGAIFDDKCYSATCDPVADANSICITPARMSTFMVNRCTMNSTSSACPDPPNTRKCDLTITLASVTAAYTSCNADDSLCATQKESVCP